MFDSYFNLLRIPFERDIPAESLYQTPCYEELLGLLDTVARNRKFCVVTGDCGVGKTTVMRSFVSSLSRQSFRSVYISDSALTPRVFYWEVLKELAGLERPSFYRNDAKRKMMEVLTALMDEGKQIPVIIIDEAHLLSYEMLEETRFLLNYKMDSQNPMGLIVVGQSELRTKLSKETFEPITQRIDFRFKIPALDLSQTTEYISRHMAYAGETRQIFSNGAVQKIFSYANGIPRKINKVCYLCLMAAAQRQTHVIEDSLVTHVIDQELTW
jgi:type II secretory pathway predicted ATPase ExeA